MKKIIRYGLYAMAGLLTLVAAVLAYIFFMFDPNSLKPQIEKLVTENTGRTLQLQGQIKLRIWPSVGATVDQASWSEYRSTEHFVELGHININLAFWPLLQQRYVVQELEIDGLKGRLVRKADGSLSIADLIKPEKKTEKDKNAPLEFAVDRIRIRNAAFSFDDRLQKRSSTVDQLSISADNISSAGLDALSLSARISNSSPTVAIKLAVKAEQVRLPAGKPVSVRGLAVESSGALPGALTLQSMKMSGAQLTVDPAGPLTMDQLDMQVVAQSPQGSLSNASLQLKRLEANTTTLAAKLQSLALTAEASAPEGRLKKLKLELPVAQLNLNGDSSLENLVLHAEAETPDIKDIVLDLKSSGRSDASMNSVNLAALSLSVSARMQQQAFALKAESPAISLANQMLTAAQMEAQATFKDAQRSADARLQMAGLRSEHFKTLSISQLKVQGNAKQGQEGASFNIATRLSGVLSPLQFELSDLTLDAKANTPRLKAGSAVLKVKGAATANIAAERISGRLAGLFDHSRGHVHAGITGFKRPAINFDIGLDQLNLNHYLSTAPATPAGATPAPVSTAAPAPIDLSPLAPLQLDGTLAIDSIQKDSLQASNLTVTVKAGNGMLNVPSLGVQAFEGRLAGSLSATTTAHPTFKIKQTLTGIDIDQVLTTFADFRKLRGHGNATVDITASGNSVEQLKKTAAGTVTARLTDGAWKGINIGKVLRETRGMLSGGLQNRASAPEEETDFSEMTATVKLADGIASNDDLSAKSPLFRIGGKGHANLVNSTMDYRVQASIVGSSQGQGGRELEQLKGLTIPIRIKGSFDKPSYALDYGAMLKDSTKAKLEEQKKQLEDKAKQQLDAAKEKASVQLEQEKKKATDKLQNEMKKGLGKLFGKP